ncbi:MAG: preprotein translocase subunit SecA [Planctomycetota bacterium]|jgi:preprotein translocase subunit SecA
MKWFKKLFGDDSSRALKELQPLVDQVNSLESTFELLRDEELKNKTQEFKERLTAGETLDDLLPEAYALVREAGKRTLAMRHFDVQIAGGIVLHRGIIAEMRTGEGKTLVATLPVYLNALTGEGVHVITVNDYLSRRDTQWMGQVYDILGLSIGVVNAQGTAFLYDPTHIESDAERDEEGSFKIFEEFLRPISRKEAYDADITYGTNNEFGFDYLRDNTQQRVEGIVQRTHNFAIIDEVDSVLIDEARVPLILSTAGEDAEDMYRTMTRVAMQMRVEEHYSIDEKQKAIQLTNEGVEKAEKLLKVDNLYTTENMKLIHHIETAVRAQALFVRDVDYVIKEGQVVIIDPFTGRMQDGRRWSDGLHQAIESKEGVAVKQESKTSASITYQNYFRFYKKLSGMTGTAVTSAEEFEKVYGLQVVVIPTNKPINRLDHTDLIFQTEQGKFKAIARRVKELQGLGQPVLIGTASVEKNEILSQYLTKEGVIHQVLNAKNHESEGMVTAQAGRKDSVTIATNMAGRGVDIKLGGSPVEESKEEEIKSLGGLHVLGTERHESRRTDNQLRGRSGRQGDPGETQFFVSLEDPLMRVFGADRVKGMIGALGIPEDEAIVNKFVTKQLEKAQARIEGHHFDARKSTLEYDDILSHHRNLMYSRRRKILFNDPEYTKQLFDDVFVGAAPEQKELLEAKKTELGEDRFWSIARRVALYVVDRLWTEHLEVMDTTRRSVTLRAYGQREPLVEYKKEGLRLFKELEEVQYKQMAEILSRINVQVVNQNDQQEAAKQEHVVVSQKKKIKVVKNGTVKEVKVKNLSGYLEAGWKKVAE